MMRKPLKIQGYVRFGRRYISLAFLASAFTSLFALGVLYALTLHPAVMRFWYARQTLPVFSINSPYLADFTGKARLLSRDGSLLYEGEIDKAVINGKGRLYENGVLLYEGDFLENCYSGTGCLYIPDGSVLFQGEFLDGLPVVIPEPTPDVTPDIPPVVRLDPLSLFGSSYMAVLTALTLDMTPYTEQPLEDRHLVIDSVNGVMYSFSLLTSGDPGTLTDVYLCGLSSAAGFVVGMETDATDTVSPSVGTAELFALGLSNVYWGSDTQSSALEGFYVIADSRLIAVFCAREEVAPADNPVDPEEDPVTAKDDYTDFGLIPEPPDSYRRVVFLRVGSPD